MGKTFISVRDVDEETFRKFRARAIENRLNLGEALTLAMKELIERKKREISPNPKNILKLKPVRFGKGNERLSEEIDEILYGGKT